MMEYLLGFSLMSKLILNLKLLSNFSGEQLCVFGIFYFNIDIYFLKFMEKCITLCIINLIRFKNIL